MTKQFIINYAATTGKNFEKTYFESKSGSKAICFSDGLFTWVYWFTNGGRFLYSKKSITKKGKKEITPEEFLTEI